MQESCNISRKHDQGSQSTSIYQRRNELNAEQLFLGLRATGKLSKIIFLYMISLPYCMNKNKRVATRKCYKPIFIILL